jgi:hypothetical protein
MKKQLLLLFIAIISFTGYSQISFEKGYFINNSGQKIDCLIKNIDWRNNPTNFKYKTSENSEPIDADITSVNEFGIQNKFKYIRKKVKIDKSSNNINNLSHDENPIFVEEIIFLKVLVESQASLYLYENDGIQRFFYNKNNSKDIEQLVYKKYFFSDDEVGTNTLFRNQLWNDLKCPTIGMDKLEQLEYKKGILIDFFIDFNKCNDLDFQNHDGKEKKDLFNLTLRTHIKNSSLSIQNISFDAPFMDFENKSGLGFGVEAEFILPYNKNKWAISIEPTYQNFKSEKISYSNHVSGGKLKGTVDYSSIELPTSLRYYLFLNKNSKFFINASYIFDFNLKSSIVFKRADNSNLYSLDIKSRNNLGFGIGYKLKDKYGLEMRYQTGRNILGNYVLWKSNYNTLSIIFGYSLF